MSELRFAVARLRGVNFRDATATGDGSWLVEGYAAVFEQETVLYDSKYQKVREVVDPRAFDSVLQKQPLVHFNHGHDMLSAMASTHVTGVGGLKLRTDQEGLHFEARVDPADPDAVRLAAKLRRGVVNQASFAFTIEREQATLTDLPDGKYDDLFRILEIRDLYDVCACAQGAYPQTSSLLRSYDVGILGRSPEGEGSRGRVSLTINGDATVSASGANTGSTSVAQFEGGPVLVASDELAAKRLAARKAAVRHRRKK